jgi:L-ascorbate metabolism protein UlaG (beta-lactamase superfamily)
MRVTLLGHASVLVELDGATCLMDPVLHDPFEEGMVVSCPKRVVDVDALPPIDILVVSHRHPDHLDLSSLDRLARDVDAICPADPVIIHALQGLGFANVHPVVAMASILGSGFELFPTRSELASIPEIGMVFHDRSGTFWNQVDTPVTDETIEAVRDHFTRIDVLFAMYASQNFEFFESRGTGFPVETHRRNLETVLRIDPAVVVPASAGFRFCGEHDWLNGFLFPVSRERFLADLARLDPHLEAWGIDPGDVLELSVDHGIVCHAAGSPVARTEIHDTQLLAFDPTAPVPPLTDANPDGYPPERLEGLAGGLISELSEWVATTAADEDRVLAAYRDHQVRYRIGLVFPDGTERRSDIDFAVDPPQLSEPFFGTPEADLVHRVAASAVAGWAQHRRSFFSVRASSRRFGTVYRLHSDTARVALETQTLPDLLMYYLVYVAQGSEVAALREVDHQLSLLQTPRERRPTRRTEM